MGNFEKQFFITPKKLLDPQESLEREVSLVLIWSRFHSLVILTTVKKLL